MMPLARQRHVLELVAEAVAAGGAGGLAPVQIAQDVLWAIQHAGYEIEERGHIGVDERISVVAYCQKGGLAIAVTLDGRCVQQWAGPLGRMTPHILSH